MSAFPPPTRPQTLTFGLTPSNPTASTSNPSVPGLEPLSTQAQYNLTSDTRGALIALAARADNIKMHLWHLYQCLMFQPLMGVQVSGRESMMNWPAFLKEYQIIHDQIREFSNILSNPSSVVHLSTTYSQSYSTPTDNIFSSTFVHPSTANIDGYLPFPVPKKSDVLGFPGMGRQQTAPQQSPVRVPPPPSEMVSGRFHQITASYPPPLTVPPYPNYLPLKSHLIAELSSHYTKTFSHNPTDYALIPDEELNRMAHSHAENPHGPEGEKLEKMYERLGGEVQRLLGRMAGAKGIVEVARAMGGEGGWDWQMRLGDIEEAARPQPQQKPQTVQAQATTKTPALPPAAPSTAPPAIVKDEDEDMEIIAIPAPSAQPTPTASQPGPSSTPSTQPKQNNAPPSSLAVPPAIARTQSGSSRGDQNEPINIDDDDDDDDDEVQAIGVPARPVTNSNQQAQAAAPASAPVSIGSAPGSDHGSLFGDDDDDDEDMEEVS